MQLLPDNHTIQYHGIMGLAIRNASKSYGNIHIFRIEGIKTDTVTDTIVSITVSVIAYTTLFDTMQRNFTQRCIRFISYKCCLTDETFH